MKKILIVLILFFLPLLCHAEEIILSQKDYIAFIVGNYVNGFKEFDTSIVGFDDSVSIGIYCDNSSQSKEEANKLADRFRKQIPPILKQYKWAKDIKVVVNIYFEDSMPSKKNKIRLSCKYSHTIDEKGDKDTSGEDLITVIYTDDGEAVIKKEGLGALFEGTITDDEIKGTTEYKIQKVECEETIVINRYTGSFNINMKIGDSGMVHFGTCEAVTEQKF